MLALLKYGIVHYSQCEDIPELLMLNDFQNAFESISWKFLHSILKVWVFKQGFSNWIQIHNTNIKVSVLHSSIKCICLWLRQIITQFAEFVDTTLILDNSDEALVAALNILVSGCKITLS